MTEPRRESTEREVIVTDRNGGGPGMIVGLILAIAAIVLVVWLIIGMDGDGGAADVVPDDVNVTVDVEGEGGGGGGEG